MGYIPARRYTNHNGDGNMKALCLVIKKLKWHTAREELMHQTENSVKAAAKKIKQKWDEAKAHPEYVAQKNPRLDEAVQYLMFLLAL